jgi:hypothetical protein
VAGLLREMTSRGKLSERATGPEHGRPDSENPPQNIPVTAEVSRECFGESGASV